MDHQSFVSGDKKFLIAPAGYGKTHAIAECLTHTNGKQLILTHTHAGVSSIKEKIFSMSIAGSKYHVETISSFAQRFTLAFYHGEDVPDQSESGVYHRFIQKKAISILQLNPIGEVLKASYAGVFVDEYQDCSAIQHNLVMALSGWMPVRILGDPLQGIFADLNGEDGSVVIPDDLVKSGFEEHPELEVPHRWSKEGNNAELGQLFKRTRELLKDAQAIDLETLSTDCEVVMYKASERFDVESDYTKKIRSLTTEDSALILHPEEKRTNPRVKLVQSLFGLYELLEAIDDKDFYKVANKIDKLNGEFDYNILLNDVLLELYGATEIRIWFGPNKVKSRQGENSNASVRLKEVVSRLEEKWSFSNFVKFLHWVKKNLKLKVKRGELYRSILRSLESATVDSTTVSEAMRNHRNLIRRMGRKCNGRYVGTTLLTKGLEFDTVAILEAHTITCPKKLYVAMTRACKRLIIFSEEPVLLA